MFMSVSPYFSGFAALFGAKVGEKNVAPKAQIGGRVLAVENLDHNHQSLNYCMQNS